MSGRAAGHVRERFPATPKDPKQLRRLTYRMLRKLRSLRFQKHRKRLCLLLDGATPVQSRVCVHVADAILNTFSHDVKSASHCASLTLAADRAAAHVTSVLRDNRKCRRRVISDLLKAHQRASRTRARVRLLAYPSVLSYVDALRVHAACWPRDIS